MYRINSVLQAERLSVVEGYKELVRQDSSLQPLESSPFQGDVEIVGMMINMIQKDMIWHNEHHQPAIRELVFLQQQLFNQRIERNRYYGNSPNHNSNMEQERNEEWNNMVNLERYHVMTESDIFQRLKSENLNSLRFLSTNDHVMITWENLEEPINENESDVDNNLFEDEEYKKENSKEDEEDEEDDDEYSETSSSADYACLE